MNEQGNSQGVRLGGPTLVRGRRCSRSLNHPSNSSPGSSTYALEKEHGLKDSRAQVQPPAGNLGVTRRDFVRATAVASGAATLAVVGKALQTGQLRRFLSTLIPSLLPPLERLASLNRPDSSARIGERFRVSFDGSTVASLDLIAVADPPAWLLSSSGTLSEQVFSLQFKATGRLAYAGHLSAFEFCTGPVSAVFGPDSVGLRLF